MFANYLPKGMELFEPAVWGLIMLGAGLILIAEALIRLLVSHFHRRLGGTLVAAAILIAFGLGNIFQNWTLIWPFMLIALGATVLIGGLLRKKK